MTINARLALSCRVAWIFHLIMTTMCAIVVHTGGNTPPRLSEWAFDSLTGRDTQPGLTVSYDGDVAEATHAVDKFSALTEVLYDDGPGGQGEQTITTSLDDSGNLTDDGTYLYSYDAWGRLLEVRLKSNNSLITHYTYDALGRLIRKQSPFPGGIDENRTEHYYYDGVRRIQEVFRDPILVGGGDDSSSGEDEEEQTQFTEWVEREYVHHMGGSPMGGRHRQRIATHHHL